MMVRDRRGWFYSVAAILSLATLGCGSSQLTSPVDPPPIAGLSCGVKRWSVKTLSDPNAAQVDMNQVHATTIRALNMLPVQCSDLPDGRTYAPEFQTYEVTGRIVVAKSEDDRDYHVALADLDDPTATIVTELADVACSGAATSMFRTVLANARAQFESLRTGRSLAAMAGVVVRVRGVGFYDFAHGQTGRSLSCMELHPLTSVEAVK